MVLLDFLGIDEWIDLFIRVEVWRNGVMVVTIVLVKALLWNFLDRKSTRLNSSHAD